MGPQKQHQTARASSGMRPGRYIGRWGRVSGSCGSRAAFSRFLNDVALADEQSPQKTEAEAQHAQATLKCPSGLVQRTAKEPELRFSRNNPQTFHLALYTLEECSEARSVVAPVAAQHHVCGSEVLYFRAIRDSVFAISSLSSAIRLFNLACRNFHSS